MSAFFGSVQVCGTKGWQYMVVKNNLKQERDYSLERFLEPRIVDNDSEKANSVVDFAGRPP